jgi:hypothetical protein
MEVEASQLVSASLHERSEEPADVRPAEDLEFWIALVPAPRQGLRGGLPGHLGQPPRSQACSGRGRRQATLLPGPTCRAPKEHHHPPMGQR